MYTVTATALYGKRSYPDTLGKYSSGHWNPVPTIRVVGHSTYDATLTAPTQATCLTWSVSTWAHSSTHILPTVHNVIRVQQGMQPPSAPPYIQCKENYSLQLVLHLHTLRGDVNNWIKTVDYNQYHIGVRLSLDAFTTLQGLLEVWPPENNPELNKHISP